MFPYNELCDGAKCKHRKTCARWVQNCEIEKCENFYVVFNVKSYPHKCPYWLKYPDKNYPPIENKTSNGKL